MGPIGPEARPVQPPFNQPHRPALVRNWTAGACAWAYPWGLGTTSYKLFVIAAAAAILVALLGC